MQLCYKTMLVRISSIDPMVVNVALFPRVGGGTGSVPVGMSDGWAMAPPVAASITARVKVRVSFLIGYSFTALVALRGG
jgi:hypothetical protein